MSIYNNIEQKIRHHEEILHVDVGVQEDDIRHAIRWVMRNNPDIFWFVHQYHFDQDKHEVAFRYQFSEERSELIQKSINDVVENDFQITERMRDHDKDRYFLRVSRSWQDDTDQEADR